MRVHSRLFWVVVTLSSVACRDSLVPEAALQPSEIGSVWHLNRAGETGCGPTRIGLSFGTTSEYADSFQVDTRYYNNYPTESGLAAHGYPSPAATFYKRTGKFNIVLRTFRRGEDIQREILRGAFQRRDSTVVATYMYDTCEAAFTGRVHYSN